MSLLGHESIARFTAAADGSVSLGRLYGDSIDLTVRMNGRMSETRKGVAVDAMPIALQLGRP